MFDRWIMTGCLSSGEDTILSYVGHCLLYLGSGLDISCRFWTNSRRVQARSITFVVAEHPSHGSNPLIFRLHRTAFPQDVPTRKARKKPQIAARVASKVGTTRRQPSARDPVWKRQGLRVQLYPYCGFLPLSCLEIAYRVDFCTPYSPLTYSALTHRQEAVYTTAICF